jgi:hypothetical protein
LPGTGTAEPHAGKHCGKGENGHGVGEGEKKGGEIAHRGAARGRRRHRVTSVSQEDAQAQPTKKKAAKQLDPGLLAHQKPADAGKPETGHTAVTGIGRGSTETGEQSGCPPTGQAATDAQDADGPDRGGNGKTENQPFDEIREIHGGYPISTALRMPWRNHGFWGCLPNKTRKIRPWTFRLKNCWIESD